MTSLLVMAGCISAPGCSSSIAEDENVILFPTFAIQDESSSWSAHVRGRIYEPHRRRDASEHVQHIGAAGYAVDRVAAGGRN